MESKLKKTAKKLGVKKPAKRRKYSPRKPKASAPLPEPIDITTARPMQSPQEAPQRENLLSGLSSLFTPPQEDSEVGSGPISTSSPAKPLSDESERLLADVPMRIGEITDTPLGEPVEPPGDDPIAALMAQVAFEPQDVQDMIEELFNFLAERFNSEHWKLTSTQSRILGRPAAQLANALWKRLQNYLPDILGRWCEETPGAMAFIIACGIVVAPKVTKQISLSRERAQSTAVCVERQTSEPAPMPAAPFMVPRVNNQEGM